MSTGRGGIVTVLLVGLLSLGCAQGPKPAPKVVRDGRRIPLLAIYYPWYGTPFGPTGVWEKWGKKQPGKTAPKGTDPTRIAAEPNIRDIAASAYPLIGPYDSLEPEVVRWHIRLAKAAGIDGFLVDWWGPGTWQKVPSHTYKAFVDVILPIAEQEGLKVAL